MSRKSGPAFPTGHAPVFELARILFDQVIPPDRKARQRDARASVNALGGNAIKS
jgi:hypothetical protein